MGDAAGWLWSALERAVNAESDADSTAGICIVRPRSSNLFVSWRSVLARARMVAMALVPYVSLDSAGRCRQIVAGKQVAVGLCCDVGEAWVLGHLALSLLGVATTPMADPIVVPLARTIATVAVSEVCAILADGPERAAAMSQILESSEEGFRVAIIRLDQLVEMAVVEPEIGPPDRDTTECRSPVAAVHFTSGTTGTPKAVATLNDGLAAYGQAAAVAWGVRPNSRLMVCTSAVFDPSVGDLAIALASQATLCVAPFAQVAVDPAGFAAAARATHLCTTPSVWMNADSGNPGLSELSVVALGGELIPPPLARRWCARVRLLNVFGITECTVYQFSHQVSPLMAATDTDDIIATEVGRLGSPFPGIDTSIALDGVLHLSGIQATAQWPTLAPQPQPYCTGDLVRRLADGDFFLVGRIDNQIKVNGQRIELEEIELAAARTKLVERCVVHKSENNLEAALQPSIDHIDSALAQPEPFMVAVLKSMEKHLQPEFLPRKWRIYEHLPLTTTGKTDRIRTFNRVSGSASDEDSAKKMTTEWSLAIAACGTDGADAPVLTPTESRIASVWSTVLSVNQQAIWQSSTFFELGGDSLRALRVVRLLYEAFLGEQLQHKTPQGMVGEISGLFDPANLIRCPDLRSYAAMIDAELTPSSINGDADHVHLTSAPMVTADAGVSSRGEPAHGIVSHRRAQRALLQAAAANDRLVVQILLQVGADPRISRRGFSPLHAAARAGNCEIVELLLAAGAQAKCVTEDRMMPAHLAAATGTPATLTALLRAGSPPTARDKNRQGLLHFAARAGNAATCRILLAEGVAPNDWDRWHRTPLQWAVINGHCQAVSMLLSEGADPNFSVRHGAHKKQTTLKQEPALHLAARRSNTTSGYRILELLLEGGADVNMTDQCGQTALHAVALAAGLKNSELADASQSVERWTATVNALLEAGVQVSAVDLSGETATDIAKRGNSSFIGTLCAAQGPL